MGPLRKFLPFRIKGSKLFLFPSSSFFFHKSPPRFWILLLRHHQMNGMYPANSCPLVKDFQISRSFSFPFFSFFLLVWEAWLVLFKMKKRKRKCVISGCEFAEFQIYGKKLKQEKENKKTLNKMEKKKVRWLFSIRQPMHLCTSVMQDLKLVPNQSINFPNHHPTLILCFW